MANTISHLLADVRYSLRGFMLRPTFAIVVVLTLALGIAVNVAIYSIFEQVLLRPLPVDDPHELVNLIGPRQGGNSSCNNAGDCDAVFGYPMFRDLERLEDSPFVGIAGHRYFDANLAFAGASYTGKAMLVSGRYFPLLAVRPALGRLLAPGDDTVDGEASAVVLSHAYWQNALGADPSILGTTLVVNGKPLTVVGVAPPEFRGTTLSVAPEVYVPITFRWLGTPGSLPDHTTRIRTWVYLFARLKPGISLEQASAQIDPQYRAIIDDVIAPLLGNLSERQITELRSRRLILEPGALGQSSVRFLARTPLTVLALATTFVLLIACVNVANLMLVRGAGRSAEIAVRASMGAARARILSLVLVEAVLLAAAAALVSLPLTLAAARGITVTLPTFASATFDLKLDAAVMAITGALALASVAAFGFAPAWKLMRTEAARVLQSYGARNTGGKAAARFRVALTTTQIALSMTLLVLACWFAQSLGNVKRIDLGLRPESLVTFHVAPSRNGYSQARADALFDRLETELAAVPGVTAVASAAVPVLSSSTWNANVAVEGFEPAPGANTDVATNWVSADFFRAVEMPLVAGTGFTTSDALDRPKVAVVNQRFVERFGLGDTAVGKRMAFGQGGALDIEIVGVVRDAKYSEVKDPIPAQVFAPRLQSDRLGDLNFYVRSSLEPAPLRAAIEQVMARLDPNLPIANLRTVDEIVRENVFLDRFMSSIAAALAVVATLLASIGLYGTLSYGVAQRTREIGLRLALGAPAGHLRGMVLRQVAWMTIAGGAVGLAAAFGVGLTAQSLLFGLTPSNPGVLLLAAALLGGVVIAAGYLPARRAARVDPVVALRSE